MALDWSTVRKEHLMRACEMLTDEHASGGRAKSIFVVFRGKTLPAKHVLRLAYCLANDLPLDEKLRFASGDNTVMFLRKNGFEVERADLRMPKV